jgi:translation initiation factor 1
MAETCPKCGKPISHNICSGCGLPVELCVCSAIEKVEQKIKIFVEQRKFKKPTTIIEGITDNTKDILKQLKTKLACGGTFKDNRIELQGDHRSKLKDLLKKLGYREEQIEIA